MAQKHFWYTLLDNYGVPVPSASVYIYDAGTTDTLTVFNALGNEITQPIETDVNGIFEFYIRDYIEEIKGDYYNPDQKMKISWIKGSDISGEIDNIYVFSQIYPVDNTITTLTAADSIKRNTISNATAYKWDRHDDRLAEEDGLHNTFQVDITDSSNGAYNKKVSNKLMNDLYSILTSASNPTILSSGGVTRTYLVSSWSSSADVYYTNINHQLGVNTILHQLYDDESGETILPYKVNFTDSNNTKFWILDEKDTHITISG